MATITKKTFFICSISFFKVCRAPSCSKVDDFLLLPTVHAWVQHRSPALRNRSIGVPFCFAKHGGHISVCQRYKTFAYKTSYCTKKATFALLFPTFGDEGRINAASDVKFRYGYVAQTTRKPSLRTSQNFTCGRSARGLGRTSPPWHRSHNHSHSHISSSPSAHR